MSVAAHAMWTRELMLRLLRWAGIDRAVFYGIVMRVWSAVAGPVSALLIAAYFSPDVQGYYYTFGSLVALQVFIELGLGIVIIHFASHEWSALKLGPDGAILGNAEALSRLRSIAHIAMRWFGLGAFLLTAGLALAGWLFFGHGPDYGVAWQAPWLALCVMTGINIAMTPIWSVLEGCNQVVSLYGFRLIQGVITAATGWTAILGGAGLWTASLSGIAGILVAAVFLGRWYWPFLRTVMFERADGPRISWQTDMLPMQWRIAVSWMSGYFAFSLFTPVLFKFHGPVMAGQMGMTWSLVGMLGFATAWLGPKVPVFGMLVSEHRYVELDRLFWRVVRSVVAWTIVLAVAIVVFVYGLEHFGIFLADRLLPLWPVSLFLVGQVLMMSSLPFSAYLRAHKREPLMPVSVATAVLVAATTIVAGREYAANGVATGYLIVNVMVLPWILLVWNRCRRNWHGGAE